MKPSNPHPAWALITALGIAQIISWGCFYYAFALLIPSLTAHLQASTSAVVGAFSLALLIAGALSAPVGAWVDKHGGRVLLAGGSLAGALLLALLSQVTSLWQLYLLWAGIGVVMAATLYDPAFAALTQMFREAPRRAITMLTLFGGFASTVFWPLTQALVDRVAWQQALLVLAAINLCISVPLQWWALPATAPIHEAPLHEADRTSFRALFRQPLFLGLAGAFTLNILVFSAMSVHLIGLLQSKQLTLAQAAWVGASIGPMQVLGRALEFAFLGRMKPSRLGLVVICMLPISMAALLLSQGVSVMLAVFVMFYGMGNGMITIVRGALPMELYGPAQYGLVNGAMGAPVLMAKAVGPLAGALLLGSLGYGGLLALLAGIALSAALLFAWAVHKHAGPAVNGAAASRR